MSLYAPGLKMSGERRQQSYQRPDEEQPTSPSANVSPTLDVPTVVQMMQGMQQQFLDAQKEMMQTFVATMQNVVAQRTPAEPSGSQLPVPPGLEGAAVSQVVPDRSDQFDPKWLPPLPSLVLGKSRSEEIEGFTQFYEQLVNWLGMLSPNYPVEVRRALERGIEVLQASLEADARRRSTRLYHILTQVVAKIPRCVDLLRTVSIRQNYDTPGYESLRLLVKEFSLKSRNEAIRYRDDFLQGNFHRETISETVRVVETAAEKLRLKLGSEYVDLFPSESDRCVVLVRAVPHRVREHLSLNSDLARWDHLVRDLYHYEGQLRIIQGVQGDHRIRACPQSKGKKGDEAKGKGSKSKSRGEGKGKGDGFCYGPCWVCGREGHIAKYCWDRTSRTPSPGRAGKEGKGGKEDTKGGKYTGKGGKKGGPKARARDAALGGGPGSGKGETECEQGESAQRPSKFQKNSRESASPRSDRGSVVSESDGGEQILVLFARGLEVTGSQVKACVQGESVLENCKGVWGASSRWLVDSGATVHVLAYRNLS